MSEAGLLLACICARSGSSSCCTFAAFDPVSSFSSLAQARMTQRPSMRRARRSMRTWMKLPSAWCTGVTTSMGFGDCATRAS